MGYTSNLAPTLRTRIYAARRARAARSCHAVDNPSKFRTFVAETCPAPTMSPTETPPNDAPATATNKPKGSAAAKRVSTEMGSHLEEQMIVVTTDSSLPLAEDVPPMQDPEQQVIQQQTVTPAEPRAARPLVQGGNPFDAKLNCLVEMGRQLLETLTTSGAEINEALRIELNVCHEISSKAFEARKCKWEAVQQLQRELIKKIAEMPIQEQDPEQQVAPEPQVTHRLVVGGKAAAAEQMSNRLLELVDSLDVTHKTMCEHRQEMLLACIQSMADMHKLYLDKASEDFRKIIDAKDAVRPEIVKAFGFQPS